MLNLRISQLCQADNDGLENYYLSGPMSYLLTAQL